MEAKRYFTVPEVNALLPALEATFGRILRMRTGLRVVYQEMESLGETPDGQSLIRTDGSEELRAARGRFRGLMEALQEELNAVEDMGAEIKDLDTGLCDFLGRRRGKDVLLCWRLGEKRLTHWHDVDSGFAGRQPLDEADQKPRVFH